MKAKSFFRLNYLNNNKPLSIKGQVLKKGINIPCRVRLFLKSSGELIKDIKTNDNGVYIFKNIPLNRYFIVAHDPDGEYNAVIQDNVIPK